MGAIAAACQAAGLVSIASQVLVPLHGEPILSSPAGEPPQVLRHRFSRIGAFPERILLLRLWVICKIFFLVP